MCAVSWIWGRGCFRNACVMRGIVFLCVGRAVSLCCMIYVIPVGGFLCVAIEGCVLFLCEVFLLWSDVVSIRVVFV